MTETTIIAIVGIVTMAIMGAFAVYRVSGDAREAAKEFGKISIRSTISNPEVSNVVETSLQHVPAPLLDGFNRIADVFDPATKATEDTLDDNTLAWVKNMTDGDLSTGAVKTE